MTDFGSPKVKQGIASSALVIGALWLTVGLPLGYLGQSLWLDEGTSIWFARQPLHVLLTSLCDPHPPGYYLLLKAWSSGGSGEVWLRLPSLAAAVLAVSLTYRLGQAGLDQRSGRLASLLLATHPLQSWYAAEVRMYTWVQAWGLLVCWLGWRVISRSGYPGGRLRAAFYGLAVVIGLGLDYTSLLPLGLLQVIWLARGGPQPWRWLGLQAAALLTGGLMWLKPEQWGALQQGYHAVFAAVQANRLGLELTPVEAAWLLRLGLLGLGLTSLVGAWFWARGLSRQASPTLLAGLFIGGWLLLLILAAFPRGYTVKRQIVVVLPYLALLSGYALSRRSKLGGSMIAGLGLLITLANPAGQAREPWRSAVSDLAAEPDPQAVIWVDELAVPIFEYYWPSEPAGRPATPWTPLWGQTLPALPDLRPAPGQTLWLVTPESTYRRLTALLPPAFQREYRLVEARREVGLGLYRYQRRRGPWPDEPAITEASQVERWGLLLPSPLAQCGTN